MALTKTPICEFGKKAEKKFNRIMETYKAGEHTHTSKEEHYSIVTEGPLAGHAVEMSTEAQGHFEKWTEANRKNLRKTFKPFSKWAREMYGFQFDFSSYCVDQWEKDPTGLDDFMKQRKEVA